MRLLGFFKKPSISELVERMRSPNPGIRHRAICALEKMEGQDISEATNVLLECRFDNDPRVRIKVPLLLIHMLPPDRCLPALLDMFFDEERPVRQSAAMALILCDWTYKGKESHAKQMNNYRKLLLAYAVAIHTDEEEQCVKTTLELSNLAKKMESSAPVYLLMSALKNRPGGIVAAGELAEIGKRAIMSVPLLIEMLKDSDFNVKSSAAGTLERITGQHLGMDYRKWSKWAKQSLPEKRG